MSRRAARHSGMPDEDDWNPPQSLLHHTSSKEMRTTGANKDNNSKPGYDDNDASSSLPPQRPHYASGQWRRVSEVPDAPSTGAFHHHQKQQHQFWSERGYEKRGKDKIDTTHAPELFPIERPPPPMMARNEKGETLGSLKSNKKDVQKQNPQKSGAGLHPHTDNKFNTASAAASTSRPQDEDIDDIPTEGVAPQLIDNKKCVQKRNARKKGAGLHPHTDNKFNTSSTAASISTPQDEDIAAISTEGVSPQFNDHEDFASSNRMQAAEGSDPSAVQQQVFPGAYREGGNSSFQQDEEYTLSAPSIQDMPPPQQDEQAPHGDSPPLLTAHVVNEAEAIVVDSQPITDGGSSSNSPGGWWSSPRNRIFFLVGSIALIAVGAVVGVVMALSGGSDTASQAAITSEPSIAPTPEPTRESGPKTDSPTPPSTLSPTPVSPTDPSTDPPTWPPSGSPTDHPSVSPTDSPTPSPSLSPTVSPTSSPTLPPKVWKQVGSDIEGPNTNDFLGNAIALSEDGERLAVGAMWHDFNDTMLRTGIVQLYDLRTLVGQDEVEPYWQQRGPDIYGEAQNAHAGASVALVGTTVAVGASGHEYDGQEDIGMSRAYGISDPDDDYAAPYGWEVYGWNASDELGRSIALSSDTNIMAVGAPGTWDRPGYAAIYGFNDRAYQWVRLGDRIEGLNNDDSFGSSLSLSQDGYRVAIGGRFHDVGDKYRAGHVQVYQYDRSAETWLQLGDDIVGRETHTLFGEDVSLNAVGNRVAIGGSGDGGYIGVYQYDQTSQKWETLGDVIESATGTDSFGSSVSMSAAGDIVAGGATSSDDGGPRSGHVRVFEFIADKGSWEQVGPSIFGSENDNFGASVSLSSNGQRIAVGAPYFDGANGQRCGHVQVFDLV